MKKYDWKLFVDGASKNNPGPSGAGVCLLKGDNELVFKKGFYLGKKTNNQAEYLALLLGIFYARKHMSLGDSIIITSDSELMVRQLNKIYSVKNAELKRMYECARQLLEGFEVKFVHVLREENTVADALANEGIEKKHHVPQEFLKIWCLNE